MSSESGLKRFEYLLELLGSKQDTLRYFHVAGTNGKGSTSRMIASILEHAGYSVGLYTSPHLEIPRERIQVWDGEHQMISESDFDRLSSQIENLELRLKTELHGELHWFEKLTAIAFCYFAEAGVDYVVLEAGLGGRLDSTNIIKQPIVSVITQIGMDHTEYLGNTILKIASEKAGIIKPGVPVVCQNEDLLVRNCLARVARENNSSLIYPSDADTSLNQFSKHFGSSFMKKNARAAVLAIKAAELEISDEIILEALLDFPNPGRFEELGTNPSFVIDAAHNEDGIEAIVKTYKSYRRSNRFHNNTIIFACQADKAYSKMIAILARELQGTRFIASRSSNSRALEPSIIVKEFNKHGIDCELTDSSWEAFLNSIQGSPDSVFALGSIYMIGEIRKLYFDTFRADEDYINSLL